MIILVTLLWIVCIIFNIYNTIHTLRSKRHVDLDDICAILFTIICAPIVSLFVVLDYLSNKKFKNPLFKEHK